MFFGGDGGGLPMPHNGTEWLALAIALGLIVVIVRRWFEED